jgi:hypothetical protein
LRERTAIEAVATVSSDELQGCGEIRVTKNFSGLRSVTCGQEDLAEAGLVLQLAAGACQRLESELFSYYR